jgi:hypothetical protein
VWTVLGYIEFDTDHAMAETSARQAAIETTLTAGG